MSKAEIVETGYKWFRVEARFSAAEAARVPAERLRCAGARLRYAPDGGLTAGFSFRAADPRGGQAMVKFLAFFGEGGYFDEGQDCAALFPAAAEPAAAQERAWRDNAARLLDWSEGLASTVMGCLARKLSRVETLRAVRAAMGPGVAEDEVKRLLLDVLRRRYGSEIFGATVMERLGWRDCRLAAVEGGAEPQRAIS